MEEIEGKQRLLSVLMSVKTIFERVQILEAGQCAFNRLIAADSALATTFDELYKQELSNVKAGAGTDFINCLQAMIENLLPDVAQSLGKLRGMGDA